MRPPWPSRGRADRPIGEVEAATRAADTEETAVNAHDGNTIPALIEHLRRAMAELREIGRQVPG